MKRPFAAAAAIAAALSATPALAGPLAKLVGDEPLVCKDGVTPTTDVVLALVSIDGRMTSDIEMQLREGTLGDYAYERLSDPRWIAVTNLANSLINDGPRLPEHGYRVTIGNPPAAPAQAVRELLNQKADWLTIRCPAEPVSSSRQPDSGWVIARSLDDADKDTDDREFATISYTKDFEADDQIIATELFVGLPTIGPNHALRPYVLYQRRTGGDPLNDLTVGLSGHWFRNGGSVADHVFYLDGAFESDDHLDSEAWRGALVWQPVLKHAYDPCGFETGDTYGISCHLSAVIDWQDVNDPGGKAALQDQPSFVRYGGDLKLAAYRKLQAGGKLRLNAQFSVREPFDGRDGDAAFGEVSLRFVPAGLPNVSFGLEYFEGEDLTSLERAKALKLTLGFRN